MRTAIAATIVAVSLSAAACKQDGPKPAPLPPDEAVELLDQRIWLDSEPRGWTDKFHLLVFDGANTGVYQDRTIWKGAFEIFIYEADGAKLDLRLPGSRKTMKTGFKVEKAKRGEADLKLTLDKTFAGPTTYYGYKFDGGGDAFVEARFGALKQE